MRPISNYLNSVKSENVRARYNLAGSTPPPPSIYPRGLKVDWREQNCSPYNKKLIQKIAKLSSRPLSEVSLSPGTSQAVFQAVAGLTNKGDSVLIEYPTYEPFIAVAKFLGLRVRLFRRTGDFKRDFMSLRKKSKSVSAILLSNPHAPSGHLYSKAELEKIAQVGPPLILDEVYLAHFSDGAMASLRHRNIVNIGGLSKSLGISNVRIGWILCLPSLKRRIENVGRLLHVDMPVPSLIVGHWAIGHWHSIVKRISDSVSANRMIVTSFAEKNPGQVVNDFNRGNLVLLRIPPGFKSSQHFARQLLAKDSVWVRAGFHFGADRFVRINAMIDQDEFLKAWKKIEAYYA